MKGSKPFSHSVCNLAIESFATEVVGLKALVREREIDNGTLREMLQAALDALSSLTESNARLLGENQRLVEECRELRQQILLGTGVTV